ncbi:putative 2-aminoethylphosphonate ABC transporter ATP-binding protein [Solimonas sp. K1W22B-7]|uniref:putative 2-aminoethylphosphonate ABC transporter ATP-binding protein n=1 Tax=Solimonas sp. K1W22B-7 TaxID=2303331 RepID=UPI000E32D63C|nr:putative 2-aminoethylphosphonate ABC transporter ATP-binding protein [Solimonas sp. K1W22B-7]AXQ28919.1 putative 2-aminoethylphosphonate ABC transporter ATP-binding protein [Solimonas sp. K1W22B-7]
MSETILNIRGLHKRYGQATALRDIDLDVRAGEFVCFLGPSGCGKTTLLRAIAGLDPQTSGTIQLYQQDISRRPPEQRGFGIVFQSYALFPNLSVLDNVTYGLVGKGLPRARREARGRELLSLVGLAGFDAKYPGQCSGGQQQRIALARALAPEPSLLLLDEPLSALDAKVRVHLRSEIKALQEKLGVTTIMVTHDQEEALTMADRIVVMDHGAIEQVGTPQDIYERPASRFVAEFVGAMNFLPARVLRPDALLLGERELRLPRPCLHPVGEKVLAAIRPEHLRLDGQGLPATLTWREFLGSHTRLWLQLDDGTEAQLLLAPQACDELPADGSRVALGFDPRHLHVYKAKA